MSKNKFDESVAGEGRSFHFNTFGPRHRWQKGDYVRIPAVFNLTHQCPERVYKVTSIAPDGMAQGELVAEDGEYVNQD